MILRKYSDISPHIMKEKALLLVIATILILSFIVLSLRETRLADPGTHEWWSLAFDSLDATQATSYTVSNFGNTKIFFSETTIDNIVTKNDTFTLEGSQTKTIPLQSAVGQEIRVNVWTESEENKKSEDKTKRKEIYRR